MRNAAEVLEVLAFALIIAGVYLLAGLGWALIAAGVLLAPLAAYWGARGS